MKFTKIATVLGLTAVCVPTMAQYEGTRVYDRIGHGQDSITTLGNIVAYKDSYKAQDYVGAYEPQKLNKQYIPVSVPGNNDVGSCLRPCYQYGTKARSLCRIEILFS